MIVVDNSVLVNALTEAGTLGEAARQRIEGEELAAPCLIDVEFASTIQGLHLGQKISFEDGQRAISFMSRIPVHRVPHQGLLNRIWELRCNYSAYDATYVALAEFFSVPLITSDVRLARGNGAKCPIELVEPSGSGS